MTDNNVISLVESAKKPTKKRRNTETGGSGGGTNKPIQKRVGEYAIIDRAYYQLKGRQSPDGYAEIQIKLCNFTCMILEEVTKDSGLEDSALLKIETIREDGLKLPVAEVSANKFFSSSSNWANEAYGSMVLILPGSQKKDNLRAAIQMFSSEEKDIPRRHVYQYTGWKLINDQWHYLTGSGAINAEGLQDQVNVDMGQGHINRYQLPAPSSKEAIKAALPAVYDVLNICPNKKHLGASLLAAVGRSVLGECSPVDFCLFVHGLTGSKKSAITSIALSFFGDFAGGVFPANWSDTDNDMEAKSFQCKDGLFGIDDFKPSVNQAEAAKLHSKAERFIRNTGNQAGRGRRNNDMTSKAAPYNRSMTVITGEDLPKGQSLLGRLLILELERHDVDCPTLSRLQQAARENQLSGLMAAYIQWLSSRITAFKKTLPQTLIALRDEAISQGINSHPRAALMYANMVAGADVFIDFLVDCGALEVNTAVVLSDDIHIQLKQAFSHQGSYLAEQDEVARFVDLLRSLFSSGNAHVADRLTQGAPKTRPHSLGWRCTWNNGHDCTADEYSAVTSGDTKHQISDTPDTAEPQGDCIGWYYEDLKTGTDRQIWLDQGSTFARVQELARKQGEPLLLSPARLWDRMRDRGLLIGCDSYDSGKQRTTAPKRIEGILKRVMVLSADILGAS